MLWDLEARTCPGNDPETTFLKAPKGKPSLELQIIWEDFDFKSHFPENKTNPMCIRINLPEVKIYAYDLDYCTICKFFQENLGEQPQTVINPAPWDVKNSNIWMYLDINLGRTLGKFFKGRREDIEDYLRSNNLNRRQENFAKGKNFRKRMFLYKNPASVALAKLKNV
jgi:vacuolar protein sorting-associated protein 13A/C